MSRLTEACVFMDRQLVANAPRPMTAFDGDAVGRRCLDAAIETMRIIACDPASPVHAYRNVRSFAEDQHRILLAARVRDLPGTRPACAKGCGWCCYLRVSSTIAEVLSMAQHVAELPRSARRDIARRAETIAAKAKGLDPSAYSMLHQPCVLLRPQSAGNTCRAYQYRPLACLAHESMDVRVCIDTWKDPTTETRRLSSPCMEVLGISSTLSLVHSMRHGGPAEVELHTALAIALTEPRAAERWIAGEPLFEPARVNPVEHELEIMGHIRALADSHGLGQLCEKQGGTP